MKKALAIVAAILGVLALLGVTALAFADAPPKGSMGVWGYVAGAKFAQLDVAESQLGANKLVVKRVVAPQDAWIVVHLDDNGMPGKRVGFTHITKGESTDVSVDLKGVTSEKVIVAVHADRGTPNTLDFDMDKKTTSPDRPFFVNKKELAKIVTVRTFGVKAENGTAAIEVSDQPGATESITIDRAVAPGPAWVVVHLNDNGMPGKRVGYTSIPAGENRSVVVTLTPGVQLTDSLLVAVHADRGVVGTLEFNMEDKLNSPDQPYFVDGKEVATKVAVK